MPLASTHIYGISLVLCGFDFAPYFVLACVIALRNALLSCRNRAALAAVFEKQGPHISVHALQFALVSSGILQWLKDKLGVQTGIEFQLDALTSYARPPAVTKPFLPGLNLSGLPPFPAAAAGDPVSTERSGKEAAAPVADKAEPQRGAYQARAGSTHKTATKLPTEGRGMWQCDCRRPAGGHASKASRKPQEVYGAGPPHRQLAGILPISARAKRVAQSRFTVSVELPHRRLYSYRPPLQQRESLLEVVIAVLLWPSNAAVLGGGSMRPLLTSAGLPLRVRLARAVKSVYHRLTGDAHAALLVGKCSDELIYIPTLGSTGTHGFISLCLFV